MLLGRKPLIEAAMMNNSPNSDSLCRTNKVNKEELVGMLVALELFLDRDHDAMWKSWEKKCDVIAKEVGKVKTVKTETFVPELSNAAPHLRITWDEATVGRTTRDVVTALRTGKPVIELRPGADDGITVGVWMMQDGDEDIVGKRLREELAKG
jgi:L-seryl-tRNA(Ser) seleniumtransferase